MDSIASRDLRNHTAEVLSRVESGETLAITVRGRVVAELRPPGDARPLYFTHADIDRLERTQADPGLREELRELGGTTDDIRDPWA